MSRLKRQLKWVGTLVLLCSVLMVFSVARVWAERRAPAPATVEGQVRDETTGEPLENVNVVILGTEWGAATNPEGFFQIALPSGQYQLNFQMVGYADLAWGPIEIVDGECVDLQVRMQQKPIPLGEVVVVGERKSSLEMQHPSTHFLESSQVEGLSGSAEDILRAIQTLPGVFSPADFLGRVYVRGGTASENIVILDRVFIYEPYHLGGAVSIFNPELIDHVEFYAGGYPAQYGMGLSSILRITNKTGIEQPLQGDVSISLLSVNAVLQGKLPGKKGAWILSTRRTYHDKLMEALGAYDNYVFPHFHDLQLKTTYPLNQSHTITFDALSSGDALKVKLENPEDRADAVADSGDLAWDNQLTLIDLDWKWILTQKAYSHLTIAYSQQPFESEISGIKPQWFQGCVENLDLNMNLTLLSFRDHEIETGCYTRTSDASLDINFKQEYFLHLTENSNVAIDTTMLRISMDKVFRYFGVYVQDQWQVISPVLSVGYGLRYEMMNTSSGRPISPRFHLSHQVTEKTRVKFSWGHYYQYSLDPVQMEPPLGSHQLKPKRAVHYIVGLEHEIDKNSRFRVEGYIKELTDLFVFGPQMQFTNYGRGSVRGLELFYERRPSGRLNGWASYAYSISRRKDMLGTPQYYPLQDQRHTASLVMNYRLNPQWRLSLKWMVHSGRPYTPVLGAEALVDSTTGEVTGYFPLEGDLNTARFPSYQRCDVRLDRYFKFQGWDLGVYLEILNLYNFKNVYDYSYSKDYSRRITTYQFPLLPAIGAKVNF